MAIKNEIALILEQSRGTAVSGQELADRLGVSRAAVWKAVKQLQDEGYSISAGTNRGYMLESGSDVLTAEGIRLHLTEKYRGIPVEVFRSASSTNTEAKAAALRGMPHGTLIAANEQTAGRGRFGKPFYSPANTGLYMSVLLKPQKPLSDCMISSSASLILPRSTAARAIIDSLESVCGVHAGIKWVNDIFCSGRKVSGILTEAMSDFESGMAESVIVGIGVNISTEKFPEEISGIAGSVGVFAERSRLCADIACRLLDYAEDPSSRGLLEKYRSRSLVLGREVTFRQGGAERTGKALKIDDRGCLVIETSSGIETLRSGEISITGGFN